MIHPGVNTDDMSIRELEEKLYKLNTSYFITTNDQVRQQMLLLIDTYKLALEDKLLQQKKQAKNKNNDLDDLINVS
jgi:hypothetical protein